MKKIFLFISFCFAMHLGAQSQLLKIASDHKSFTTGNDLPFFWLGDTGWLLFKKCTRAEAIYYLDTRKKQGFNVIQAMLLHELTVTDVKGDSALIGSDVSKPNDSKGYWAMVDFVIAEAAKRKMYMALVPVWGGNVKGGHVSENQARAYAQFLAARYKKYDNIIWLNGGDIKGSDAEKIWNIIGETLHQNDGRHLITFHPRGRSTSSTWFHNQPWLDFNMFQSGHKDYVQDTTEPKMGEDNYKYVINDLALQPTKPTMDGEPSYENIPHGLHDSLAARWTASDIRRYAYWNLLAGGAGFTYGENSVMQFKTTWSKDISFGPVNPWTTEMEAPGANQMKCLKRLVSGMAFIGRKPAQELIQNQGVRYQYLPALLDNHSLYVYTYTGRNIELGLGRYEGKKVKCSWYNPRNGGYIAIGNMTAAAHHLFDPPGVEKDGNDWVLVVTGL